MQIRQSSMADGVFHTYYFEKNLQGDIIGVYNSSGNLVYSYVYDAWGNFTATKHISSDTFAAYNPFRYRGYYYDTDFGFYYLNSRYYDPITGRFINEDSQLNSSIIGFNQFAYCENNPVMRIDPFGTYWTDLDDFMLEGAAGKGYFDKGTAYHNYLVKSKTSLYDSYHGGYGYEGTSGIGGGTAGFAFGNVTVTDDMATDSRVATSNGANKNNVHGNSLKSTRTNYGYALVDSNKNILKFGETINPTTRYSRAYLEKNDATMIILDPGSKIHIHLWQHDMNEYYRYKYGKYPPLNKKGW